MIDIKPMIAVMPLFDYEMDSYWMLPGYMEVIAAAGALPVMLPLTENEDDILRFVRDFDGFLLTGGQDVSPPLYNEEAIEKCGETSPQRDNMEKLLINSVIEADKPLFGICRGIQILNAVLGGTLYQDLPSQYGSGVTHCQKPPYDKPVHRVRLVEGAPIYRLLKKETLYVNSYHHQAVKVLAEPLRAAAYSEDGLVEGVYLPGKKFIRAIQWHPEFSFKTDENSLLLIKDFINACKKARD